MGIASAQRTIALISKLPADAPMKPVIDSHYSKSSGIPSVISQPFERVTPESVGLSSEVVLSFIRTLHDDKSLKMHNVMIVKDGKCICDASFGPYDPKIPQYTFSACKSVTSIAIGCLIDEGKLSLDDNLADIFKEELNNSEKLTVKKITVKNLLMMQSGMLFAEISSAASEDWLKGFAGSIQASKPGTKFAYNSINTYILARIVAKISGISLTDYLKKKIFKPLGITNYFWEKCPRGYAKGGWGLYIAIEDFAKLGVLLSHKGMWNGKRLLSEEYIEQATSRQVSTPAENGDFDYGFQIWSCRLCNAFLFNGMFGQNVLVFPDKDLVIVSTAGNNELFQKSTYFGHVLRHFNSEDMYAIKGSKQNLQDYLDELKTTKLERFNYYTPPKELDKVQDYCEKLDGKKLIPNTSQKFIMGFMDICNQAVSNYFSKGLVSVEFSYENGKLYASFEEPDKIFRIPVGFSDYEYAEVILNNSVYKVAVLGRFTTDEDGKDVLKIKIDYLESPSTKIFKFKIDDIGIVMSEEDYPGETLITSTIRSYFQQNKKNPLISSLNLDRIIYRAEQRAAPMINMTIQDLLPQTEQQ
ncbi:MAG: beta-lactamase family protein [Clostridiales bacterium]|nr:beta-lactamase family protein [Clostridiales bacterium]